jgi:Protein of unknown function (DUF2798)
MKISGKIFGMIFSVTIGLVMSFFMSLVLLLINAGPIEGFFGIWIKSFISAFAVSLPVSLIAVPIVQKVLLSRFVVQD